jgi:hypothetical protein
MPVYRGTETSYALSKNLKTGLYALRVVCVSKDIMDGLEKV